MNKNQLNYIQYHLKCCNNCKNYIRIIKECKIIDMTDNKVQELSICDKWIGK